MTDGESVRGRDDGPGEIDTSLGHPARMYDYLLGGTTNFEVDRAAVEAAAQAVGGIANARADVAANRGFLGRAVRYLARDVGVRQFLDIGCGIPGPADTATVAQQVTPDARVVYVDHDPIVLAHAHVLLNGAPKGAAAFIDADLRNPDVILTRAGQTLDLSLPVGVVLVAVLHFFPDEGDPFGIVSQLMKELAPGSYLVISHLTADFAPDAMNELAGRLGEASRDPFVLRDRRTVGLFLGDLELVEPGVVQVDQWHPDPGTVPAADGGWMPSFYGAMGLKPLSGSFSANHAPTAEPLMPTPVDTPISRRVDEPAGQSNATSP